MKLGWTLGTGLLFFCIPSLAWGSHCSLAYSLVITSDDGRLNTDILQERFGPIHVSVVRADKRGRDVRFEDAQNMVRGYARTHYLHDPENVPIAFYVAQKLIDRGAPIGKTFRELGYEIIKEQFREVVEDFPPSIARELGATTGTKRSYTFVVRIPNGETFPYAQIEEWNPL